MGVRPKKHLGQHFLLDMNAADRIAGALPASAELNVLEIGPGEGVLTERLLKLHNEVHVAEIDAESVAYLKEHSSLEPSNIHEVDFLKWTLPSGQWSIIGNFPYNISSQIVFKMLDHRQQVKYLVGMFQKEVAERIVAPPGSKVYGILSVLTQAFYDGEYLFTVEKEAFNPPPKVRSGVIRLERKDGFELDCDERFFVQIVKQAFNQRRKMLRNTLKSFLTEENIPLVEAYLTERPEQLHFSDFVALAKALKP